MRKNKKLLLIIVVAIVAVSGVVAAVLLHGGQEPSNGPSNNTTPEIPVTPTTPSTLTMLSITDGNVFVRKTGTDNWIAAQVGMSLKPGDTVKSGDSSSAEITFFDGSTIELDAGTEIEVVSLNISDTGSTTIKLKQVIGSTISRVEKLVDSASSYEVETPACVAAVRGSVMLLDVIEGGVTWVTNFEGDIWVIANGVELKVPQGQKCIITPGEPPQLVTERSGGGGGGSITDLDIAVTKASNVTQAHDEDLVTYTYVVTNPGNVPLSDVSVTDDVIGEVTYQSGDTNEDGKLDTDETWIFAANYTVSGDDPSPLVNTAAAAGTYSGSGTIIAWDSASVDILRPAIAINKTGELWEYEGYSINYTYTITNPGNTPLSDISVTDDMIEEVTDYSGDTNSDGWLDTDETWLFTATYWLGEEYGEVITNNATASGTDALGLTVTAEATASVTITATETASIYVQITGQEPPTGSIFIWDENTYDWAIDEATGWAINGTNHSTPSIIEVAGGHYYYVWVDVGEGWYGDPTEYPDGWEFGYYPPPEGPIPTYYGYAAPDNLYSLNFTIPY